MKSITIAILMIVSIACNSHTEVVDTSYIGLDGATTEDTIQILSDDIDWVTVDSMSNEFKKEYDEK